MPCLDTVAATLHLPLFMKDACPKQHTVQMKYTDTSMGCLKTDIPLSLFTFINIALSKECCVEGLSFPLCNET